MDANSFKCVRTQHIKMNCDSCGYTKKIDKVTKDIIDKPCPKCGAIIIKKKDYDTYKMIRRITMIFNIIFFPVKIFDNISKLFKRGKIKE